MTSSRPLEAHFGIHWHVCISPPPLLLKNVTLICCYVSFSFLILYCCHCLTFFFFWVVLPWNFKKFNQNCYLFARLTLIHCALNLLIFSLATVVFFVPFFRFLTWMLESINSFRTLKAFKAMNLSLGTALPTYTFNCSDDVECLGENIIGLRSSYTFIRILLLISWPWASVYATVKWDY